MKNLFSSGRSVSTLVGSFPFSCLWLGQAFSLVGDECYYLALAWLLTDLTHSSVLIGMVRGVGYVPTVLLLVLGGAWIDRRQAKAGTVVLWADLLRLVFTLIISVLVTLEYISLPLVFVVVIFYGLVQALFSPAFSVLFLRIVPSQEYSTANALLQLSRQVAPLLGAPLAGYLIARWDVGAALAFDALTFAGSALSLLLLRTKAPTVHSDTPLPEQTEQVGALQFLRQERGLLAIFLLSACINLFNNVEVVLMPLLVRTLLHVSAEQFALLTVFAATGSITGALAGTFLANRIPYRGTSICGSYALYGAMLVLMGVTMTVAPLYAVYFGYGLTFIIGELISSTLRIYLVPVHLRGRVFSSMSTIAMVLNPVGFLLAGVLGGVFGIREGMWIGGGAILFLSIVALFVPAVRSLALPKDTRVL